MHNEPLEIRLAQECDAQNVFNLSNDKNVRLNSFNSSKIIWDEHLVWFSNKLKSDGSLFYIAQIGQKFVGYCRLDKDGLYWVVTIHLNSEFRAKGLGREILKFVCCHNTDKKIIAYVKKDNLSSYNMFLKAGFNLHEIKNVCGFECFIFKKLNLQYVIAISNELYDNTKIFEKKNVLYITKKDDLSFEKLKEINPKYVFFPHWSYIIPKEIHNNYNCVIFHMTDLPFGRGGSPLQNLIERGIYNTKITALKCSEVLDGGDIYLKRDFDISQGSASELYYKAGEIISEMIDEIILKTPVPIPQSGEVVEFKRRTPKQSNIKDLSDTRKIYDYIRMLDAKAYPKAYLENKNIRFVFSDAKYINNRLTARVEIIENENNE